ncbi:hypothetical protein CRG98_046302 [Punica granatum]|uniref:Neprosin PEP catalytic domain-containing protein n=1 Tax=Punica granatum TaxID=22663 RepID=A0A2I0HNJ7_PUNGR|nr:hypothetical protein CRG98_046302 [Punica granatum]
MTTHKIRREVIVAIYLLIAVAVDSVQARRNLIVPGKSNDAKLDKPPRGIVKTIQSGSGDVVDCVDIYKQPAFDHPLLKNHIIQMKSNSFIEEEEEGKSHLASEEQPGLEEWGVDCPEGTIPIIRRPSKNSADVKDYVLPFPFDNESLAVSPNAGHEYAQVSLTGAEGTFQGAQGIFNLWTPLTENNEISVSQIWILAGPTEFINTVEAGWIVGFTNEAKPVTRFFTYWTVGTGLNGAVPWAPAVQDKSTGHWWLRLKNVDLGYWPGSIFTSLRGGASAINWGGEITNSENNGQHTTTQMGSGHFPRDGFYTKSSYIRNLGHIQNNNPMQSTPREALQTYVTNRQCYDLVVGPPNLNFGTHIYFGGPGFSAQCSK